MLLSFGKVLCKGMSKGLDLQRNIDSRASGFYKEQERAVIASGPDTMRIDQPPAIQDIPWTGNVCKAVS